MKRIIIAISLISLSSSSVMPAMSALGCMGSSIASGFKSAGRNVAGNLSTFWPWYAIGTVAAAGLGYVGYLGAKKEKKEGYDSEQLRRFERLQEIVENYNEVTDVAEYHKDKDLYSLICTYNDQLDRQAKANFANTQALEDAKTNLLKKINEIIQPIRAQRYKWRKANTQKDLGYIGATLLGALMIGNLMTNRSYQWHECSYHPNPNPDRFESGDELRARFDEALKGCVYIDQRVSTAQVK